MGGRCHHDANLGCTRVVPWVGYRGIVVVDTRYKEEPGGEL